MKELVKEYESGLDIRKIAIKYGFSYEKTRQILLKSGVQWSRKYVKDFSNETEQNIVSKFDDGISIKDIAREYEISAPAIARLLAKNNRKAKNNDDLRSIPLTDLQKQILVGHLLGDGSVWKDNPSCTARILISQCKAQEEYFNWKVNQFSPYILSTRENIDKNGFVQLNTSSITHPDLDYFWSIFYKNNKIIPDNLEEYLTPIALAVWIQDDGNLNEGVNMRIACQGFTEIDQHKLKIYLKKCYNLESNVKRYNSKFYHITLDKKNTLELSNIIKDHVVDCMRYKLAVIPRDYTLNIEK